jgi:hypothetical protein
MCVICDGVTPEDFLVDQRQRIEHHGFTMVAVERDVDHPAWLYTIGLVEHDHPELAVVGMPLVVAADLVGGLARLVVDGDELAAGDTVEVSDVAGTGLPLDIHLQAVDHRLWQGPMFSAWHGYYEWLGAAIPAPEALELVPCGSESIVTPLSTARPNRATRRRQAHSGARYRPLSA